MFVQLDHSVGVHKVPNWAVGDLLTSNICPTHAKHALGIYWMSINRQLPNWLHMEQWNTGLL